MAKPMTGSWLTDLVWYLHYSLLFNLHLQHLLKLLSYFFKSKKLSFNKLALFLPAQTKNTIKRPDAVLNPRCMCHWRQSRHRALSWIPCCNIRLQLTWLQRQVVVWQNYSTSFDKKPPIIKSLFCINNKKMEVWQYDTYTKSMFICSSGQRNSSIWPCCRKTISNLQTRTLE